MILMFPSLKNKIGTVILNISNSSHFTHRVVRAYKLFQQTKTMKLK